MPDRKLDVSDNVHLDSLLEAFDVLQRTENAAAKAEGMGPVCHNIGFWRIEGTTQLYIVGIEFGLLGEGTQFKPAYIVLLAEEFGPHYRLEWK